MANWKSLLLLLLAVFIACRAEKNGDTGNIGKAVETVESKPSPYDSLLAPGASLMTGHPIPAKGKRIDPDSVFQPVILPVGQPKVFPIYTNIHPAGKPKKSKIPGNLPLIIPGKDSIPLPQIKKEMGRVTHLKQPKPVTASPLVMEINAVADFQLLGVNQGLNSAYVTPMLEDRYGNLWFGTGGGGINRYDGRSFTQYSEEEGLLYSSIHSLFEDSQGNLWIGTDSRGMSKYDGHNLTHYTEKEGFSNFTVKVMLEDSQGILWFGTEGGGLIVYDGKSFTHYTQKNGLSSNMILSMLKDKKGNLWLGTRDSGLIRYDELGFTHFSIKEGLSNNKVTSILEDSKGNLWLGTERGINCFDGYNFYHYGLQEGLSHDLVNSLLEDEEGHLWIATGGGGINKYDGHSFIHYTQEEGLANNTINSIIQDSRGNLWFGVQSHGVGFYNKRSFTFYNRVGGPRLEDQYGRFLTDYNSGIAYFDFERNLYMQYSIEKKRANNYYSFMMEDSRGNSWIGIRGLGLRKYTPSADGAGGMITFYTTKQGLSADDVSAIIEDRYGNTWIGTHNTGVNRFDPEDGPFGSFTQFNEKEGLIHYHIHALLEDSKGNIWIGTDRMGISKFTPNEDGINGTFTHYTKKEGLSSGQINTIIEDSKGNIWIGTWNGGLNIYDGKTFTIINTADGLSNNIIQSIIEDKQGRFWVSTEQGLNLLVPSLNKDSLSDSFHIISFDKADGIKNLNIGGGFLDSNNRLWFNELMLDLNRFELPAKAPRIQLNHLELKQTFIDYRRLGDSSYRETLAFGKYLDQTFDSVAPFYNYPLNLKLPYQINHLTFNFSAIDWTAPHKITYQFMLDGLDKDWNPTTTENKADYRSIPSGTFTFRVRAAGQTMIWSEPFSYTFTIRPPWWLTWWAYCLYGLLITGLILGIRQYELKRYLAQAEARRLRDLDSVKTKLYTNITHEFRTPLTVISGMAEQIREPKEPRTLIKRNSKRLLRLVNQMLDLSKLESGKLSLKLVQADVIPFLEYLVESFHSYAESKNIKVVFQKEIQQCVMDYDEERLQTIVSNLLSNAIKFTPEGGEVELLVRNNNSNTLGVFKTPRVLELKIKDTGVGIPPDQLPYVFDRFYQVDDSATREEEGTGIGLTLTKELVELMGGSIQVESQLAEGTTFTVQLPIQHHATLTEPLLAATENLFVPIIGKSQEQPPVAFPTDEDQNHLLIIEDNPDVVTYIRSCLQVHYRIEVAVNGAEGIEKAIEMVPDIIISDVMMPRKDGFEVCATLKQDERTSHIPIILLTAKADVASRIEGLERGADAYLAKPFDKKELLVRLEQLIQLRRRLRERYASGEIPTPSDDKGLQMEDAFLQKIRSLIEENLDDAGFGILQLCQALHLSRMQVHRKLKALTDQTTSQIIRSIRLQNAKKLLQTTGLTISEIAYDTGFTDPNHFSRVFKEEFGVTPSEARSS